MRIDPSVAGELNEALSAAIAMPHEAGRRIEELTAGGAETLTLRAQDEFDHAENPGDATILIVDNEIANRKLLEAMLLRKGYVALCAASGEEALALVQRQAPDLILLDIVMPNLNGYEVARTLKANPATAKIPIIMVTAHTDRRTRLEGLNAGAEEFLTTPVDQSELWLRVRNLLRLKAYTDFLQDHTRILEEKVQARAAVLQRFRRAMDATADGIFLINRTTMRFVEVNATACNMLGYTHEELIQLGPTHMGMGTREQLEDVYDAIIRGESAPKPAEVTLRCKDGSTLRVEGHRQAHRDGPDWIIVAVVRDITERTKSHERIVYLNRVYAMLSGINTLIVRARDRNELFTEACGIAVEQGGFRMAWIGILDRSTMKIVPVASAGMSEESLSAIKSRFSASIRESATLRDSMAAQAIEKKQVMVSNDMQGDPRIVFTKTLTGAGISSMAMLPLIVANETVGLLAFYAGEIEFFHEEEMKLLMELASDIAFAIEHIGKVQKIARLSRVQAVMSGINSAIVRVRDREELFSEACRIAVEDGKLGLAWIGVLDPPTQDVTPVAWAGEGAEELTRAKSSARLDTPQGKSAVARAIHERRPIFNNDITNHPYGGPRLQQILKLGFRSQITLPLFEGGPVAGTLTMYAKEPDFFVAEELALLTEMAGNISFALDHIGKEEKIARLSRIQAVMSGINAAIVHVGDRQQLFNNACRIAVEQGGFGIAWIGRFDPVTQDITPMAWAGIDAEVTSTKRSSRADTPAGQGLAARAVREKTAVFDNDIAKRPDVGGGGRTEAIRRGYGSLIALPLLVAQGAVVGTLSLFAKEADFFDAEELTLLTELAGNIAFAMENISREEKLDKLSRIRVVSGEINAAIVRIAERDALLQDVCRIAREHGKFGFVWIAAVDEAKRLIRPVAWTGFSPESARAVNWAAVSAAGGTLGEAIQTRKTAMRSDIHDDLLTGGLRREAVQQGCRSTVCLPLMVAGEVVALIALFAPGIGFFDNEELALLNEVAANVSFALEHIGNEQKIARLSRIQAVTSEINSLIVRVRDRQELFDQTCRAAVEQGKFGNAYIGTLDSVSQVMTPVAWAGPGGESLACPKAGAPTDVVNGTGVVARAIREKRAVFDNDIATGVVVQTTRRADAIRLGFHSLIAVPFVIGDKVVGHLSLYSKEAGFFNDDEVKLLNELAGNISFALEHIDRQEKLAKLSRIRAVSGEINAAIVRTNEREALLQEVCRIATDHGKFELVWVASVDAERQTIRTVAREGFSLEAVNAINPANMSTGASPLAEVMQTRRPAVRNEITGAGAAAPLRQEAVRHGCRSTICLPLLVDDNVVAVISLFAQGSNFFDADELAMLTEVGSDLSFALQSIVRREKLDYLAYYDALTGLANRALFLERLEQGVAAAKGQRRNLALVFIDIERFKTINDTLGRQAGDVLLKRVAERMMTYAVDAGRLARIDADHFAVMVTGAQTEEELVHLIEQRVSEVFDPPFTIVNSELRVSAKLGVAIFPADGVDAETLFRNAEAALENAKARGDRYLFYTESMNERAAEKLSLENRLRLALERQEFVLHYQPKVNLASGKITSAEALIRWSDPQTGLVPPGRFIPILEETGLIYEVGRWALRQAIGDYLRWQKAGLPAVRIAVNVSPLQLRNRGFVAEIGQVIAVDGHAPAGLELEITESVIMDDVKKNIGSLAAIRAMGVSIAIDDFGTGFSSLSYLARLPVDTLKIDRSFVVDMTRSPEGLALVSTIINLAHALKRKVVAEGVETEEQARLLRLLNCDEMQGFLFSEPVPAEIFETRFLTPAVAGDGR